MKVFLIVMLIVTGIITSTSCRPAIVVTERPAPPAYIRPLAPRPGYVWIDGDWYVSRRHYYWREGYWAPPARRARITGEWSHRGNGWYWRRGHRR